MQVQATGRCELRTTKLAVRVTGDSINVIEISPDNSDHWELISTCLVWLDASALSYQNNETRGNNCQLLMLFQLMQL